MKKTLYVLFVLVMALSLTACSTGIKPVDQWLYNVTDGRAGATETSAPAPTQAPQALQPTPMPTAKANGALPGSDALVNVCDFTTADAKKATGVDVQRLGTEACAWVWRAVPKAVEETNCPNNMVCTLHLQNDKKVVVQGDGVTNYQIVAGTWRIWSAYPLNDAVRDVCRLLAKEQEFGAREVPSFTVEAGNFSCPAK